MKSPISFLLFILIVIWSLLWVENSQIHTGKQDITVTSVTMESVIHPTLIPIIGPVITSVSHSSIHPDRSNEHNWCFRGGLWENRCHTKTEWDAGWYAAHFADCKGNKKIPAKYHAILMEKPSPACPLALAKPKETVKLFPTSQSNLSNSGKKQTNHIDRCKNDPWWCYENRPNECYAISYNNGWGEEPAYCQRAP